MQDGCKSLDGVRHGIEWIMCRGHLDFFFQKLFFGGRFRTKSGDCGILNAHNCWFILFLSCVRIHMSRIH